MKHLTRLSLHCALAVLAMPPGAAAQGAAETAAGPEGADLAKQLSNPISSLVSVPLQYNFNDGYGDGSGRQSFINIQPVIPFSISPNWNVISRTIIPLVDQDDLRPGSGSESGLGNVTQSFFFSPKEPTSGGLIWGIGPVLQIPVGSDDIAPEQWGAGITGVALKQSGPWTVGGLANHVWSISGSDEFGDQSATYLQPFVSYTTPRATSFTLNTESSFEWESEEWSVPINFVVSQVVKLGDQPMQLGVGAR